VHATDGELILSATDLSNFLGCSHRTVLDLAVTRGQLVAPSSAIDLYTRRLRERGEAHERAYLEHLRAQGLQVVDVSQHAAIGARVEATRAAMAAGVAVVYQAAFARAGWVGFADVLRKVESAPGDGSVLGDFHYEPYDTKLARETRGGTILQLALYADLLGAVQGVLPRQFFVVTPGGPFTTHEYRLADYAAYVRRVRQTLLEAVAMDATDPDARSYPEPTEHCAVCRWWERCHRRWRKDDHLSFIAGVTRAQRDELIAHGVSTLAAAAALDLPLRFSPARGSRETYDRIVEQAQVQLEQRERRAPVVRTLPVVPGEGLSRLPEPTQADLFLDLEGARFACEGGRDYLFGLGWLDASGVFQYRVWWAMDAAEEQQSFEELIDAITIARAGDPALHVYHFAPYEVTALKRLAGRYATRQDALDDLLRGKCLVDLYGVVRQAVRAGVESYSIKELEQYYGYVRRTPLRAASVHRCAIEMALEAGDPSAIEPESRETVEFYNREDVESTRRLRDGLEELRSALLKRGTDVRRPVREGESTPQAATERTAKAAALRARLLEGLPPDASEPGHAEHWRWLLAYLVDWHHREEKASWWEFFRLRELPEDALLDEPHAVAGLQYVGVVGQSTDRRGRATRSVIHRYRYPPQEVELAAGDTLKCQDESAFGDVVGLDRAAYTLDVKRTAAATHPSAAFSCDVFNSKSLQDAVMRFAEAVLSGAGNEPSAAADLLRHRPPRLREGTFRQRPHESAVQAAVRLVTVLDRTTLAIQGPPGAGKTFVGAQMIRAAVRSGLRVGVTATSHKVIQNLLDAVIEQASGAGEHIVPARKVKKGEDVPAGVRAFAENDPALDAVRSGDVHVLGGTPWLWAHGHACGAVDLLFVDEAGQFSLANAVAVAQATDSVVLLGDSQQLAQPQKATHPEGVGVSALAHVLGEHETMPSTRGMFMPETWRLAPAICAFTSELFYGGRLRSVAGLDNQCLTNAGGFNGAGLWWVAVTHEGNRSASDAEVDVVAALIGQLRAAAWRTKDGTVTPLEPGDFRVVAPYNAQVNRLALRLEPLGVPVGTVDRFQGQTCAVVIYSTATSRPEDAPRGMEFLYSLNRLNVATSRARCAAFIVGSPALLDPPCRTPRQMQLANALCRFVELARRPGFFTTDAGE
jgi:uncharacterized protein